MVKNTFRPLQQGGCLAIVAGDALARCPDRWPAPPPSLSARAGSVRWLFCAVADTLVWQISCPGSAADPKQGPLEGCQISAPAHAPSPGFASPSLYPPCLLRSTPGWILARLGQKLNDELAANKKELASCKDKAGHQRGSEAAKSQEKALLCPCRLRGSCGCCVSSSQRASGLPLYGKCFHTV